MGELANNKTFEDKMKARVKESIGDLMSDEDLSKIVARGIEDAFFKVVTVKSGYHTKELPPLAVEMVQGLMKERVNKMVNKHMKENPETINEIVKGVLESGLGNAFLNAINERFRQDLYTMQVNITDRLAAGGL